MCLPLSCSGALYSLPKDQVLNHVTFGHTHLGLEGVILLHYNNETDHVARPLMTETVHVSMKSLESLLK